MMLPTSNLNRTDSTMSTSTAVEFEDLSLPPSPTALLRPPPLVPRFLHGGPPLSDLSFTSLSSPASGKENSWRAFSDSEHERLEEAWNGLTEEQRRRAEDEGFGRKGKGKDKDKDKESGKAKTKGDGEVEKKEEEADAKDGDQEPVTHRQTGVKEESDEEIKRREESDLASPDDPPQPHLVPVGLDSLFTVDLLDLALFPVFWKGQHVRVHRGTWFYPTTSGTKFYPVDTALSRALDAAYDQIKPWQSSYGDELASALELGDEAEEKLKVTIEGSGVQVIFQGADSARLFSSSYTAKLAKSLFTTLWGGSSGKHPGHQSGTLVVRGYDNAKAYRDRRLQYGNNLSQLRNDILATAAGSSESDSDSENDGSHPHSRSRAKSRTGSGTAKARRHSTTSVASSTTTRLEEPVGREGRVKGKRREKERNTTEEAMRGSARGEESKGEVDELVLVVHGIGQRIARYYESFSFVHAVNQLRTLCDQQSKDPTIEQILKGRRIQFIPLLWRVNLDFESDINESEDSRDENLGNRFRLEDIEIKGTIPFVRQVVGQIVMDVPFYLRFSLSPSSKVERQLDGMDSHHKDRMIKALVKDANRVYRLFCQRNPYFVQKGRVSIIAHSLGSALATDILSIQPTWVPQLDKMTEQELRTEKTFVFNVHNLFFLGSPVGFFFHMHRTQLIARRGRKRTKDVPKDVALDRAGRYGCLAIDTLYNVYSETDPIAYCLNATVDSRYASLIQPIAIPSTNQSLLQSISSSLSKVLEVSKLWGGGDEEQKEEKEKAERKPIRPMPKRLPTEILTNNDMSEEELKSLKRAERRFWALNPQGCIDFVFPQEGMNQYLEMLSSHAAYWTDPRFSTFILTQVFADDEDLSRSGRELLGKA
ncbi:hypothetical protein BT69DRAFT_1355545 [Atractiella rhizophila]|nr:hypothetical protein BT69DRAFT_1355545 [Atractiella rhizophila]